MGTFCIIWLVVGLLAIATAVFLVGFDQTKDTDKKEEFVFHAIMFALIWPMGLAGAIALSPFYGIYRLGKFLGKKQ